MCKKTKCTSKDLAIIQWTNYGVTDDIGKPFLIDNYGKLNRSNIFSYESISNLMLPQMGNERISYESGKKLFGATFDNKILDVKTALFNFDNAKFLQQHSNMTDKIHIEEVKNNFELSSDAESVILINFYKSFEEQLGLFNQIFKNL